MKNTILYYYNIEPDKIVQSKNEFKIFSQGNLYLLVEVNRYLYEIEEIYNLSYLLAEYGFLVHQPIYNINKDLITNYNDKSYCLMQVHNKNNKKITLEDIIFFSNEIEEFNSLKRDDWHNLWANKIDFYEEQILEIGLKYPNLRKTFSYFVGLSENAISLSRNIKSNYLCVSHKRITHNFYEWDFLNPFNLILDSKVRDVSEFFKYRFIYEKNTLFEVFDYINNNIFNKEDATLLFARLMYPSFYFDVLETIIDNKCEDKQLEEIIIKINDFELFLEEVYLYLKNSYNIETINWLEKKRLNRRL